MMITEAVVFNYKGIKKSEIKDLRRVNLFIGKNDSGKSSILEAIFHTCKEFVGYNLNNIMDRRTNVFTGGRELWYRYNTKPEIIVSLRFGDLETRLTVEMKGEQINTMLDALHVTPQGHIQWRNQIQGATYMGRDFTMGVGRKPGIELLKKAREAMPKLNVEKVTRYVENVVFIDCRGKSDIINLESRLGQIKLDGKDEEFGSILENIYGKGKEWEFLPHPDSPDEKRIAIKEHGKRVFLSDFGDGFRYGAAICGTAMTIEGTGIFIEEIENHQHHGSLKLLIQVLLKFLRRMTCNSSSQHITMIPGIHSFMVLIRVMLKQEKRNSRTL